MRHPRTWPVSTSVFLAAAIASCVLGLSAQQSPDQFSYWFLPSVAILALGIAFLASRVCWWIFAILGTAAMWLVVWMIIERGFDWISGWDVWIQVLLQASAVGLLLSPAMIRWVRPIGQSASPKVQYVMGSLAPIAIGGLTYAANF